MGFIKKIYKEVLFLFLCMILCDTVCAAGFKDELQNYNAVCNGAEIPYGIPYIISNIIGLIKVGIPIILIVFGMIDFGRAVMASDDKQMKEAASRFIRRMIASVIIFFVVAIVQFVFRIIGEDDNGPLGCLSCFISDECDKVSASSSSGATTSSGGTSSGATTSSGGTSSSGEHSGGGTAF